MKTPIRERDHFLIDVEKHAVSLWSSRLDVSRDNPVGLSKRDAIAIRPGANSHVSGRATATCMFDDATHRQQLCNICIASQNDEPGGVWSQE